MRENMSEYIDDIEYIDQYYQDDEECEESSDNTILWSLAFNELVEEITEIIYHHRKIDNRFDYLSFDSIMEDKPMFVFNTNNTNKNRCPYLYDLATDIHDKIQSVYLRYFRYIEYQQQVYDRVKDSEYKDFKLLVELFSYNKKRIYNNLLNRLDRYWIR